MNDIQLQFTHLKNALTDYAMALQSRYKDNLLQSDRVASGVLINSIQYQLDFQDKLFTVSLNLEDYWKYVENDTRPHFPPPNKILEWIKIKPVLPRPNKNGKLPTPKQLAYLIGRKISKEGTKGSKDLERTLSQLNADYEEIISEALDKDMAENIDFIIRVLYKP